METPPKKSDKKKQNLPEFIKQLEQNIPPVFVNFLQRHKNLALVLESDPETGKIRIGVRKIYSPKVKRILEKSKQALAAKEKAGYSRENAIKDFWEAQDEISKVIEEAQAELAAEEKAGYNEERSWQDFDSAQKRISNQIKKTKQTE